MLGIVLDGIPESIVIGLGLLEGGGVSVAVLAAVFLPTCRRRSPRRRGWPERAGPRRILCSGSPSRSSPGLASLAGYALFDDASPATIAFVLAFAGGAILTMLADTMMPEAFEYGGRLVGVFTTLGFALAFAISSLE